MVIGSSAAGLAAAITGKSVYPNIKFTVISKDEITLIPCIPYTFASIDGTESKESNVIFRSEVIGGASVVELTNRIGIIIQNRMNINSILTS